MALTNLEKFVNDYSNDVGGLKMKFKNDPDGIATSYGLSAVETSLVKRGDAHEIKSLYEGRLRRGAARRRSLSWPPAVARARLIRESRAGRDVAPVPGSPRGRGGSRSRGA